MREVAAGRKIRRAAAQATHVEGGGEVQVGLAFFADRRRARQGQRRQTGQEAAKAEAGEWEHGGGGY